MIITLSIFHTTFHNLYFHIQSLCQYNHLFFFWSSNITIWFRPNKSQTFQGRKHEQKQLICSPPSHWFIWYFQQKRDIPKWHAYLHNTLRHNYLNTKSSVQEAINQLRPRKATRWATSADNAIMWGLGMTDQPFSVWTSFLCLLLISCYMM